MTIRQRMLLSTLVTVIVGGLLYFMCANFLIDEYNKYQQVVLIEIMREDGWKYNCTNDTMVFTKENQSRPIIIERRCVEVP